MLFGCAFPNPHPPSLSCAIIGPAHFPVLNPQQLSAQSASLVHGPVMNCVPAATAVVEAGFTTVAKVVLAPAPAAGVTFFEEFAVGAGPVKPRATAAVSLGSASPKPQPPSRSWATIGPAHFPVLNPQQLSAHSASLVHGPVMNCVPFALAALAVALDTCTTAGLVPVAEGAVPLKPRATAAVSLGSASPKPQPPSRSWATIGPAHFPVLNPQQPSAQSASLVQGPVIN